MQLQFLAPIEIFLKTVERLQFLTRAELYFLDLQFLRAVCHVYTFLLRREHSTTVEG